MTCPGGCALDTRTGRSRRVRYPGNMGDGGVLTCFLGPTMPESPPTCEMGVTPMKDEISKACFWAPCECTLPQFWKSIVLEVGTIHCCASRNIIHKKWPTETPNDDDKHFSCVGVFSFPWLNIFTTCNLLARIRVRKFKPGLVGCKNVQKTTTIQRTESLEHFAAHDDSGVFLIWSEVMRNPPGHDFF